MAEKRRVYTILETEKTSDGQFIPCIATEGESGYHKTDWAWGTDFEKACSYAETKNLELGIEPKEAHEIIMGTIRLSMDKLSGRGGPRQPGPGKKLGRPPAAQPRQKHSPTLAPGTKELAQRLASLRGYAGWGYAIDEAIRVLAAEAAKWDAVTAELLAQHPIEVSPLAKAQRGQEAGDG